MDLDLLRKEKEEKVCVCGGGGRNWDVYKLRAQKLPELYIHVYVLDHARMALD